MVNRKAQAIAVQLLDIGRLALEPQFVG